MPQRNMWVLPGSLDVHNTCATPAMLLLACRDSDTSSPERGAEFRKESTGVRLRRKLVGQLLRGRLGARNSSSTRGLRARRQDRRHRRLSTCASRACRDASALRSSTSKPLAWISSCNSCFLLLGPSKAAAPAPLRPATAPALAARSLMVRQGASQRPRPAPPPPSGNSSLKGPNLPPPEAPMDSGQRCLAHRTRRATRRLPRRWM
mmetsp:Transcript_123739/g.395962  ORF Transcript_123739/g.395962 Transcript_123739/m.395962 type:complete len:206 (+) Transcript_123739:49-666(+)